VHAEKGKVNGKDVLLGSILDYVGYSAGVPAAAVATIPTIEPNPKGGVASYDRVTCYRGHLPPA